MIHSLAGGSFRDKQVLDFAKVKIIDGIMCESVFWYALPSRNFSVGDRVEVPLGKNNTPTLAEIIRIDLGVVEGQTPVPIRAVKYIKNRK